MSMDDVERMGLSAEERGWYDMSGGVRRSTPPASQAAMESSEQGENPDYSAVGFFGGASEYTAGEYVSPAVPPAVPPANPPARETPPGSGIGAFSSVGSKDPESSASAASAASRNAPLQPGYDPTNAHSQFGPASVSPTPSVVQISQQPPALNVPQRVSMRPSSGPVPKWVDVLRGKPGGRQGQSQSDMTGLQTMSALPIGHHRVYSSEPGEMVFKPELTGEIKALGQGDGSRESQLSVTSRACSLRVHNFHVAGSHKAVQQCAKQNPSGGHVPIV